ncbi:MAG: histidine kinase [Chitinophagaceae bacterium]
MKEKLLVAFLVGFIIYYSNAQTNVNKQASLIVRTDSMHDNLKAITILDSLIQLPKIDVKEKVEAMMRLATLYIKTQQLDKATQLSIKGIDIAKQYRFDTAHANFYKLIGAVNYYNNQYAQAIHYFFKSAMLAKEKGILYLEVINYQNIGGVYIDFNKKDSGKIFLHKAIDLSENCGKKCQASKLTAIRLLGTIYEKDKNFSSAEKLYQKGFQEALVLKDTNVLCSYLIYSAELFAQTNKVAKAIDFAEQAVALMRLQTARNEHSFLFALRFLGRKYQMVGKHKEAAAILIETINLQIEISKKQGQQQVNELTTKFKVKELEQEKDLEKVNATTQKQQKQILLLSLLALITIIALAIAILYVKNKKKEAEQQQRLTKAIVAAEEAERKRIASDLHDGVGQLFSAVKMNLSGLLDRIKLAKEEDQFLAEKTMALVDESCKEVRVISHKMMPNFLLKSGIASDIRSFIEKIDENSLKIHFETKGFTEQLEFNEEVILYRVIQELISNVIKHAKANELHLMLEKTKDQIHVLIADNGTGFNYEDAKAKEGLGLKNILVRIEYLKGTIQFLPNKPSGTLVEINIPII